MLRIRGYLGALVLPCLRRFWRADVPRMRAITTIIVRTTIPGMMGRDARIACGSLKGTTSIAISTG